MSWKEKYKEHLTPAGQLKRTSSTELKTEVFIARAKEVHGENYDYSKTVYVGSLNSVTIICPIHGEFLQNIHNHLQGKDCRECCGSKKKTTQEFVASAVLVHGNTYTYESTKYINNHTKVKITCPEHGDFEQRPGAHLDGQGCPSCRLFGRPKKPTEEFIAEAIRVHGTKYTYDNVLYTSSHVKVLITCPEHGDFEQRPDNHLRGQGCPKCAVSNQNTIYLIEYLSAGTRLGTKVGITNNFDQRFSRLRTASPYDMELVQYWIVDNPRELETKVLKQFTRAGNLGAYFEGSTEILQEPIEEIAQFIEELVYATI